MSPVPSPDPMRDERLERYDLASRPVPVAERCRRLALHAAASAWLDGRGEAALARGASMLGTVSALVMAATPAATEDEFGVKVGALRAYVGGLSHPRRAHVAAMVEAALVAEGVRCMSMGRPPHGRLIGGWMEDVPAMRPPEASSVPPDDVDLYATAGTARVVDDALDRAIVIIGDLIGLPKTGAHAQGAYDMLEEVAFRVCAEPAATRAELEDSRVTSVILRQTLRRRRPMAAAVIRARLLRERRRLRATASEGAS